MKNNSLNLVLFFYTVCLLSVLTGCKDSRQKSVLELAAETEENYGLNEEQQICIMMYYTLNRKCMMSPSCTS